MNTSAPCENVLMTKTQHDTNRMVMTLVRVLRRQMSHVDRVETAAAIDDLLRAESDAEAERRHLMQGQDACGIGSIYQGGAIAQR